jgi:outer membrane protein assembly factor BamA
LLSGENRDRGYFVKLLNYSAENSIDADIHPLNAHSVMLYHQNSTAKFNSFYRYKMSKFDASKWMMLSDRIKNTLKIRTMLATSSGDYDFQLGGHNDLRGYSTRPIIGRKAQLYSLEYSHLPVNQPLQFKFLSINKVYPALFYDIATAYDDYGRARWYKSAGVEFKTRLLIFRKTPLAGKIGVAYRLGEGREKEFYTAFDLKF